ncbi:hypothetical protein DL95DRAFT_135595 [Leptodontidium sp. 2 PMI_412]|nr:hypothetical protein DL95DRAFT_135595 [Leptodontidium sp. 2 PMI_412]
MPFCLNFPTLAFICFSELFFPLSHPLRNSPPRSTLQRPAHHSPRLARVQAQTQALFGSGFLQRQKLPDHLQQLN